MRLNRKRGPSCTESIHAGNRVFGRNSHSLLLHPPLHLPFIFCVLVSSSRSGFTIAIVRGVLFASLNTSRPDYRTESNSFEIEGGDPGPLLKSRLQIRFRVSMSTVCVCTYSLLMSLQTCKEELSRESESEPVEK